MATTKIWDIKGRVDTLINYAANPEKTEGQRFSEKQIQALHDVMDYASDDYKTERSLYVSGVNTTPDTAKRKMHQTKLRYGKTEISYFSAVAVNHFYQFLSLITVAAWAASALRPSTMG